jgi:pyridoxal phosphate enzyme (YggS family)
VESIRDGVFSDISPYQVRSTLYSACLDTPSRRACPTHIYVIAALKPQLASNLESIQKAIHAACQRCGRGPDDVTLVAVTKYAELEWIRGLYELGLRDFGESRPQQLVQRAALFPGDVRWHLIGHLQRNKAGSVWPVATWLHSVDSVRLANRLGEIAASSERRPSILLEVNVSGEASKDGFAPDDLRSAWPQLRTLPLQIAGLMAMAPEADDSELARPVFQQLRALRDKLHGDYPLPHLSMGMSGDFTVAIEEGATLVRVGSRLFAGLGSTTDPA